MAVEIQPSVHEQARHFLTMLSAAADVGEERAIETVYHEVHKLVHQGDFEVIDAVLYTVPVRRHAPSVLLSLLTITALSEVRRHLVSRAEFFNRVQAILVASEGEDAARDLSRGLE